MGIGLLPLIWLKVSSKNIILTFLCTIRKNNVTLVSYLPKRSKNDLLDSSWHYDDNVDPLTGKSETILGYNSTKGGVDTVDKLCASSDCVQAMTHGKSLELIPWFYTFPTIHKYVCPEYNISVSF